MDCTIKSDVPINKYEMWIFIWIVHFLNNYHIMKTTTNATTNNANYYALAGVPPPIYHCSGYDVLSISPTLYFFNISLAPEVWPTILISVPVSLKSRVASLPNLFYRTAGPPGCSLRYGVGS